VLNDVDLLKRCHLRVQKMIEGALKIEALVANESHGAIYRQNSKPTQARNEESVSKSHWLAKCTVACSLQNPLGLELLRCPSASCLHATELSRGRLCWPASHPCPSVLCSRRSCWKSRTGAGCTPRGCVPIPGRTRYGARGGFQHYGKKYRV